MRRTLITANNRRGFTILELMIATTILAIILLIATTVFISIGNLYTKGVDGSQLQDQIRQIAQNLDQTIQFSSVDVTPASSGTADNGTVDTAAICLGTTRFSYALGYLQGTTTGTIQHDFWEDQYPGEGCPPADLGQSDPDAATVTNAGTDGTGADLLNNNQGLNDFSIEDTGDNLITVTIDAFQQSPGSSDDIIDLVSLNPGGESSCKGGIGDQFCYTAHIVSTVARRVVSS